MLKKTISYTDYNGTPRTEDFYFNLTKAEIAKMEASENGGLSNVLEKIVAENDTKKIIEYFEKIIFLAYGEKSEDGRRFIKSEEISEAFSQTEAYSELFIQLLDADYAAEFVNGILPDVGAAAPVGSEPAASVLMPA